MAIADLKYFVVVFMLTLLIAVPGAQQQEPGPHEGQPAYCTNHELPGYPLVEPHSCECDSPCHEGEPEDSTCKVFCRKDHCHCIAECDN